MALIESEQRMSKGEQAWEARLRLYQLRTKYYILSVFDCVGQDPVSRLVICYCLFFLSF